MSQIHEREQGQAPAPDQRVHGPDMFTVGPNTIFRDGGISINLGPTDSLKIRGLQSPPNPDSYPLSHAAGRRVISPALRGK